MSHTERPQGAGRPAEGPDSVQQTRPTGTGRPGTSGAVRRFRFTVLEGPQPGQSKDSNADTFSIGSHGLNDFVIEEPTVSRFHCEVKVDHDGARLRDLDSRNGTVLDGVHVRDAYLRGGSILRLGRVSVRFDFSPETNRLLISDRTTFGELVGSSPVTRASFALMERAAASDATVLLEGETGTGKSRAAFAIHQASARASGPFLTVDCGAIPGNLLESELFGHVRGAFTGAVRDSPGHFRLADKGSLFLDEVAEMPLDLQAKMLRVLETRTVIPVGGRQPVPVDVRIIAATHRPLRREVETGRFRADLMYRLRVVPLFLPTLRERRGDILPLALRFLEELHQRGARRVERFSPGARRLLEEHPWPGNVRELRNVMEYAYVIGEGPVVREADLPPEFSEQRQAAPAKLPPPDASLEPERIRAALAQAGGNRSEAARLLGVSRVTLWRRLRDLGATAER